MVRRIDGRTRQPAVHARLTLGLSISKLVVSTVVSSLVESDTLDLQQPITTWLDDFRSTWPTITLHQLLSNTSGLGHWGVIPVCHGC